MARSQRLICNYLTWITVLGNSTARDCCVRSFLFNGRPQGGHFSFKATQKDQQLYRYILLARQHIVCRLLVQVCCRYLRCKVKSVLVKGNKYGFWTILQVPHRAVGCLLFLYAQAVFLSPIASANNGQEILFSASSVSVSGATPVHAYLSGWKDKPHGGKLAWTRNRIELGYHTKDFYIGYQQRLDYILEFNRTAADIYYRKSTGQRYPEGEQYVSLRAWHLRSHGLKLAWEKQWSSGISIQPVLVLLNGWQFQEGNVHGVLTIRDQQDGSTGSQDVEGVGQMNYRYSVDKILEHDVSIPKGQGFSLGLTLQWKMPMHVLHLSVLDAYGHMWWANAPYTIGNIGIRTADEGHLLPHLAGHRNTKKYRQKLHAFTTVSYTLQLPYWDLQTQIEHYSQKAWLTNKLTFKVGAVRPMIGMEWVGQQILLGLQDAEGHVFVQFGMDHLKFERARQITLLLGGRFTF